jgi:hypothetical protein
MHASSNTPPSIGNSLFGVLQKYAKEHGHARVPVSHVEDGITLRRWVNKQRTRRHSLSEAKSRSLQQVPGWTWDSHGVTFMRAYAVLQCYVEWEGIARVRQSHVENSSIWAAPRRCWPS